MELIKKLINKMIIKINNKSIKLFIFHYISIKHNLT